MKISTVRLFVALLGCGGASATFAQLEGEYQIQPLMTRYAETAKKVTFDATARIFRHVQFQEADRFDGWTVDMDLTVPIPGTERFQVRLYWPAYTEGRARLIKPGQPDQFRRINVDGYTGLFDFASAQLEYQMVTEKDRGYNFALYGGAGTHTRVLWTSTLSRDRYNDQGNVGFGGLKLDWRHGDSLRFAANLGGRYYWVSDDLNPTQGSDGFWLCDASAAAIFHPWKAPIYPAAELVYQGEFNKYNSLLFVPEVIVGINSHLELKAGASIGIIRDGENIGGRVQVTARF